MVQTLDNYIHHHDQDIDDADGEGGELMVMKNTSSSSGANLMMAVVSESNMIVDNDNVVLFGNSSSTTENSKVFSPRVDDKKQQIPSTSTTTTSSTREYLAIHHDHAMSIINQMVREGKLSSCSTSSDKKDDSDHQLAVNCQSLAQLLTTVSEQQHHTETINPLSPNFLLVIAFKTVRLLDLLHKHHLVYRNLTLDNILIERLHDGNLNVHLNNLDKEIELLVDNHKVNATTTLEEEHAGYNAPLQKYFNFNRNAELTIGYQPPELLLLNKFQDDNDEKPFICLKSEIWSLAICILRVLFRKEINIHQDDYVEQLDELFGKEVDEDLATQDETKTILTCLKEMTRNMLRPDVHERWSCADVTEYICLASTFLKSITQEFLNQ